MKKEILFSTLLLIAFGLSGCEERSNSSMQEVHWDRDMCARCVMVVSDRRNSVQVRNPSTGETLMFDDLGCTILWFKENNVSWRDKAVIWITDVDTSKWIDAKTAFYDGGNITPMSYGFSAHTSKESIQKDKEVIDFNEVTRRVLKKGFLTN